MVKFVVTTLLLLTSGLFIAANGQDQTVTISGPPTELSADKVKGLVDTDKAEIVDLNHACELIQKALGLDPTKDKKDPSKCTLEGASVQGASSQEAPSDYIIHVLLYKNNKDQTSQVAVDKENWYVYNQTWNGATGLWNYLKDPRVKDHFKETRIFGESRVALVYVHLNVPGASKDQISEAVKEHWALEDKQSIQAALDKLGLDKLDENSQKASIQTFLTNFKNRNVPPACVGFDPGDALVKSDLDNVQPAGLSKDDLVSRLSEVCAQFEIGALWAQVSQGSHDYDQYTISPSPPVRLAQVSGALAVDERYVPIDYKVKISQKTPQPLLDLESIGKLVLQGRIPAAEAGQRKLNLQLLVKPVILAGGQAFDVKPLPSDMEVDALVGGTVQKSTGAPSSPAATSQSVQPQQLSKQTFDNEKKYRYNFSFALPFNTFQELQSTVQAGSVSNKLVQRQNLFAMVNFSPFIAYDTKKPQAQLLPVIMYGLPISGKPLDRHLVALAVGLNKVQVFAGLMVERTLTSTGTSGDVASRVRWVGKLAYGVNLPVSNVVNILKGSSAKTKK